MDEVRTIAIAACPPLEELETDPDNVRWLVGMFKEKFEMHPLSTEGNCPECNRKIAIGPEVARASALDNVELLCMPCAIMKYGPPTAVAVLNPEHSSMEPK